MRSLRKICFWRICEWRDRSVLSNSKKKTGLKSDCSSEGFHTEIEIRSLPSHTSNVRLNLIFLSPRHVGLKTSKTSVIIWKRVSSKSFPVMFFFLMLFFKTSLQCCGSKTSKKVLDVVRIFLAIYTYVYIRY